MHDLRRAWSDCRSDHFVDDQGRLVMAWAYQTAGRKDGCDEILILGFALKDDPTTGATAEKSRPDVTHEMSACLVDPRTLIDFSTSLFEQPWVSPLTPALATVQWRAASDEVALRMAALRVAAALRGDFGPTSSPQWRAGFEADLNPSGWAARPNEIRAALPNAVKTEPEPFGIFAMSETTRRRLRLMVIAALGIGASLWATEAGTHGMRHAQMIEWTGSDCFPDTTNDDGYIPEKYLERWYDPGTGWG